MSGQLVPGTGRTSTNHSVRCAPVLAGGARPCEAMDELRRCLLTCRELSATGAKRANELRALLLLGDPRDRAIARGRLGDATVADLSHRAESEGDALEQLAREAEIRRLAGEVRDSRSELAANMEDLRSLVNAMAPGLTAQHRVGPIRGAELLLGGG